LQLSKSLQIIEEEQLGVQLQLTEVRNALQKVAVLSERYQSLAERLESLLIELNDVSSELSQSLEQLEANPVRLDEINGQFQFLNDLMKKHHVQTMSELIEKRTVLEEKNIQTATLDETLARLISAQSASEKQLNDLSLSLSENRTKVIPKRFTLWKIFYPMVKSNLNWLFLPIRGVTLVL